MKRGKGHIAAALTLFGCLVSVNLCAAQCRVLDPQLQEVYEGPCFQGLADGLGRAKGPQAEYQGEFHRGMKHGKGTKVWSNGDRYVGIFQDDQRHGAGRYTWGSRSASAGDIYEGQYVSDRREGWGTYEWANGDRYQGPWKSDQRQGRSIFEVRQEQARQIAVASFQRNRGAELCRYPIDGSDAAIRGIVTGVSPGNLYRMRIVDVDARLEAAGANKGLEFEVDPLEWQWCRSK